MGLRLNYGYIFCPSNYDFRLFNLLLRSMKVFKKLENLPTIPNAVLTIGSFDGVHQGHQKILSQVRDLAKEEGGESVVVTFHPHPRHVLSQDTPDFKLITTVEEKAALLANYGIDNVIVVPFNADFYKQSPRAYIEDFLIDRFHPRWVVIGYDHQFGNQRKGSIKDLRQYEAKGIFKLLEIERQEVKDIAVSSTKIRKALVLGNVEKAAQLLGHPFSLTGKVTHGQRIGHTLGYPTANIELAEPNKLIPVYGIYAVNVCHHHRMYQGMLYIGDRPTLANHHNKTIEVNIFDFDQQIYGDQLRIDFVKFLRKDERFDGLEALKVQLGKDKVAALEALA